MSSLAELALEHARLRLAGQPIKSPTSTVQKISMPPSTVISAGVIISGPINHFMFLEGRAWAVDMVKALRASSADQVIERLTGAAVSRPGSYASGIKSVIEALSCTETVASGPTQPGNLTSQE